MTCGGALAAQRDDPRRGDADPRCRPLPTDGGPRRRPGAGRRGLTFRVGPRRGSRCLLAALLPDASFTSSVQAVRTRPWLTPAGSPPRLRPRMRAVTPPLQSAAV